VHIQAGIMLVNPGIGLVVVKISDLEVFPHQDLKAQFEGEQKLPDEIFHPESACFW
jgi:hypothetical protein